MKFYAKAFSVSECHRAAAAARNFDTQKIKTRAAELRGLYCKVKLTDYSTLSGIPSKGTSPVGAA
jgi:hypothetical protein